MSASAKTAPTAVSVRLSGTRAVLRAAAAVCVVLLVLSQLPLVAAAGAAGGAAAKDFVYFVFSRPCLDKFLAGDLFDVPCLKVTVSKLLGFAIIAGACIVKVPQIVAFIGSRSVAGVSREATYFDLLGYLLQSVYHIALGSPFSAYGETVIITVQSVAIVGLMWLFDFPGFVHAAVVAAAMAAATQAALSVPAGSLVYVQGLTTMLFIVSRVWQITANVRQGGTGKLSALTLVMNLAGSTARIFTSSVEVKQPEVLVSFVVSSLLNAVLVAQFIYYRLAAPPRAAVLVAPPAAAAAPAKAAAEAAAPAAEEPTSTNSEAKQPGSGGARKRAGRKQA